MHSALGVQIGEPEHTEGSIILTRQSAPPSKRPAQRRAVRGRTSRSMIFEMGKRAAKLIFTVSLISISAFRRSASSEPRLAADVASDRFMQEIARDGLSGFASLAPGLPEHS
jgi:hypothetical protein